RSDLLEKVVNLQRMVGVGAIDNGERVELRVMLLEQLQPANNRIKAGLLSLVDAVLVVQLARAIDGEADEELLFGEELSPFVVQQCPIGLQGVADGLAVGILALEFNNLAEVVDTQERWLTALPGEADLGQILLL